MDDLAGAILGIIIAVMVIVALIYLMIYVVIPGAMCFFLGRTFYRQIKKYQLGQNAKLALGMIGALSLIISSVIILGNGINGLAIAPLSGLIFLGMAIPTLGGWAYSKKKEFLDAGHTLNRKRNRLDLKRQEAQQETEELKSRLERLMTRYQNLTEEQNRLDNYLRELCQADVRVYTIKRREWAERYQRLAMKEIEIKIGQLEKDVRSKKPKEFQMNLEQTIQLCLLKRERLQRIAGLPFQEMASLRDKIARAESEAGRLDQETARLQAEIDRNNQILSGLNQSRIVLN